MNDHALNAYHSKLRAPPPAAGAWVVSEDAESGVGFRIAVFHKPNWVRRLGVWLFLGWTWRNV